MSDRLDAMHGKESNGRTYWTKLGAAFKNRSGSGYTLVLDAIPASVDGQYRISLFEPTNDRGSNSSSGTSYNNSNGRPGADRGQSQNVSDDDIPF